MEANPIVPLGYILLTCNPPIPVLHSPHRLVEINGIAVQEPEAYGKPWKIYTSRDDVSVILAETPAFEHWGIEVGHHVLAFSGDRDTLAKAIGAAFAAKALIAA